jgi:hypothetical protein
MAWLSAVFSLENVVDWYFLKEMLAKIYQSWKTMKSDANLNPHKEIEEHW